MAYTADPVTWPHQLVIGDTYQPAIVTLEDDDGAAYNLTGATGVCQIRTEPGGTLLLSPTVSLVDAANGQFTWISAAASTASLQPQRAKYSVRLTFADATVRTIVEGPITIRPSVVG